MLGSIFVIFSQFISDFSPFSLLFHILLHACIFFFKFLHPLVIDSYGTEIPVLPLQVSNLIIILHSIWLKGPNIKIQNNSLERKSRFKAPWKTRAQQQPQVLWSTFSLLFLNVCFFNILFIFFMFVSFFFLLSSCLVC